jgi:hypothetical protein
LIESLVERINLSTQEARSYLEYLEKTLNENVPEDWRFTKHPSGFFLIYDLNKSIKIFGISFRISPWDSLLGKKIDKLAIQMCSIKRVIDLDVQIKNLRQDFLRIVNFPDAEISHELKTIYHPEWGINDIKKSYEELKKEVKHSTLVKLEREAFRPNAIISEGELWARQET